MSDKENTNEGPKELREVRSGASPEYGESLIREGYKPPKPSNLGQPDIVPVPPSPPQNSQTGKQPENPGKEKK